MWKFWTKDIAELRARLVRLGAGALRAEAPATSVAECFERVVKRHRLRTALGAGVWQPTYEELNITANRLAHALIGRRGEPGCRRAVLMQPDAPLFAAVLAVIKSGGIVVVFNPSDPPARLRRLVEDAEPDLIIADASNRDLAANIAGPGCGIVSFEDESAAGPAHNPLIKLASDQTVALVYTSGSTGHPKGVMMTHCRILYAMAVDADMLDFGPGDRIPLLGPPSYGAPFTRSWRILLNGATLYPFPINLKGITDLANWMIEHDMTVYMSSASIFRSLMNSIDEGIQFPDVRTVWLSAEPATADDFRQFKKHFSATCAFVHTLASTEAGNIAISRRLPSDKVPEGPLSIGPVSKGVEVLVLDEQMQRVAPGEVGEIVVKSRGLAAGYWRNPALTAERFSNLADGHGARLFHTEDLGRINAEGILEFAGRKGRRVKIRGNLIELTEVEDSLRRLPGVALAAVETIRRAHHEDLLGGFVVPIVGHPLSPSSLRSALRLVLPNYMVPSVIVLLKDFPLTLNGKVDRNRLMQIPLPARTEHPGQEPVTDTERAVAEIWADVFELPSVGRRDDFFDLGGDSLIAAAIGARVHADLGAELNLETFADHPVLMDFSRMVEDVLHREYPNDATQIVRVARDDVHPLSFGQERIWNLSKTAQGSAAYTIAHIDRILGPLDVDIMRDCFQDIVGRHDILRTAFEIRNGQPVQVIRPLLPVPFSYFDLAGDADAERRAQHLLAIEAANVFDLTQTPLLRFFIVRIRDGEHWLLRTLHHIISDGVSKGLFFRELALLYEAKLAGDRRPLPRFEDLQYVDYAAWQRNALRPDTPSYRKALEWWKDVFVDAPLPPVLPFQRAEPVAGLVPADGYLAWGVGGEISRRLKDLRRTEGVTNYIIWLAAFAALLAAETGRREVVIGTYVDNRSRVELQNMLGFFTNLVTLRLRCDLTIPFSESLAIVRRDVIAARRQADIPYEQVTRELGLQEVPTPEIRVIFSTTYQHTDVRFGGLEIARVDWQSEGMPWGFSMKCDEQDGEHCWTLFDVGLYDPVGVRRFIERLRRLLDVASREPNLSLDRLIAISAPPMSPPAQHSR